ncbi:MAG: hypothetical protein ABI323_13085 [Solirubrobacteraceae bacterium]
MRSIVPIAGLVALVLAGCGSSSRSSSVSTSKATPTTASSTSASASSTSSATTTHATSTTSSTPASAGPELPANFTIKAGGTLSPPSVAAPGRTPILLTISTTDARTHHVALGTPQGQRLTVRVGHPARVLLRGLRDGSYAIEVDGHPRGKLIVGATPGP